MVDGDADLEARFAGDGVEVDGAAVFADDALDGVEAEAGAVADALGGEEGFEDVGLNVLGNAGAVVDDFHQNVIAFVGDADAQFALIFHGVGGVVDKVGPDLIEFAAVGGDFGDVGSKFADYGDTFFELVLHDRDGGFEAANDVHFLHGGLIHVGVFLDGFYERGDAAGAVSDLADDALHFEHGGEAGESGGHGGAGGEEVAFEMIGGEVGVDEKRAELPGFGNLVTFQPGGDGFFAVAAFELVLEGGRLEFSAEFGFDFGDCGTVSFGEIRESVEPAEAGETFEESVGGASSGGGRIVEFMGEAGGKLSKSGEFVELLFIAGNFADSVGKKSDEALAEHGHALEHFLEQSCREQK